MKELDWENLPFDYYPTTYNVRCTYSQGAWSEIEATTSETLQIHMGATCLHYAQEAFEGLKAFRCADGNVRLFRAEENAARLQRSCRALAMPEISTERFIEMCEQVIRLNQDFLPPVESNASLYLRPLIIGTTPHVGVLGADEFLFVIFASPVGPYIKGEFVGSPCLITRTHDRCSPHGTGSYKVGCNYAGSLAVGRDAHAAGYACEFYLDAKEKKYIDECGFANFFGIRGNTYITPKSTAILPSVTNKSLMQLAQDMGMTVEQRPVAVEELSTFEEAGACGTGAIISPISRIDDPEMNTSYVISPDGKAGPVCTRLYRHLKRIQRGLEPDTHHWNHLVEL